MKLWKVFTLVGLLIAIAAFFSTCGKNYDWNQKIILKVQTPDGERTASSVMEARLEDTRGTFVPAEANGVSFQLRGEAVVLELVPGRYLFALLKGVPSLGEQHYPKMDVIEVAKLLQKDKANASSQVTLDPKHYPLLVTFGDINDPASVKRVDPANLEATFGPGYRLNSITLSLTDEPVTKGNVGKVLGWIDNLAAYRKDPKNPFTNTLPHEIGYLRSK